MITLIIIGGLVGVAAILGIRSIGRQRVLKYWTPTMLLWRSLRVVMLIGIAAALWLSGRIFFQLIAVIAMAFVVVYFWLERPHQSIQ
jgi:hypothetical protein